MIQDSGSTYLPVSDGNGNIHGLIKASDGSLAAAYEYDAFGQTLRESGPYAASNPFRFSSQFTDLETGLVYYGLRYYSPTMGRFINKDPIEESGGLNLYGFCGNNGVNRWDYLGLDPTDLVIRGVATLFGHNQNPELDQSIANFLVNMRGDNGSTILLPGGNLGLQTADSLMFSGASSSSATAYMGKYFDANGNLTWIDPNASFSGGKGLADRISGHVSVPSTTSGDTTLGDLTDLDSGKVIIPGTTNRPVDLTSRYPGNAPNNAGSLTLGDKVRIMMGVASAVSPGNPVAGMIDKGVAVGQMTGSVFTGINAAINPVYGVLEGGYQNITGRSLNPDSPQATLTFGQRVLSGISAELNLAGTIGVGTLGAKLLSPSLPPLLFEGPTPGLQYGNGRVFQLRVDGQQPLFRVDYQPIPGSGTQSILHIDSPPLNISHLPITTPPPPPSGPMPPVH